MKHRGEPAPLGEVVYIYDHEYWGNICSGFGGRTECENTNLEGRTCTQPPDLHRQAKHREPYTWWDYTRNYDI